MEIRAEAVVVTVRARVTDLVTVVETRVTGEAVAVVADLETAALATEILEVTETGQEEDMEVLGTTETPGAVMICQIRFLK